jgi:hypothetical protein
MSSDRGPAARDVAAAEGAVAGRPDATDLTPKKRTRLVAPASVPADLWAAVGEALVASARPLGPVRPDLADSMRIGVSKLLALTGQTARP